jgi:hypothetical protein
MCLTVAFMLGFSLEQLFPFIAWPMQLDKELDTFIVPCVQACIALSITVIS